MTVLLRMALTLGLLLVAGYGFWEMRRWERLAPDAALAPRQKIWRILGFLFLFLTIALWLRGTYLPVPHTRLALAHALGYWLLTASLALPLIPIALLDARENLQRALRQRRDLRESVFTGHAPPGPEV